MTKSDLKVIVPDVLWTKALLDGTVKVDGFDVSFMPVDSSPQASMRLRGRLEEEFAGGEQVLPDYLVRLARGVGQRLVCLPVFLTRGMVHRKLIMRRNDLSPQELNGRAIGVSRLLAATSVFLRGMLTDDWGIDPKKIRWVASESFTSDDSMGKEWPCMVKRLQIKAWELLPKLVQGELDAVLYPGGGGGQWFHWLAEGSMGGSSSHYGDLEGMMTQFPTLWFPLGDRESHVQWFKRHRMYPLFHVICIQEKIAREMPGFAEALTAAFARAEKEAVRAMKPEEKRLWEEEKKILGDDPNGCELNSLRIRTIERLIDYLDRDGLLPRPLTIQAVFPKR